MSSNDIVTFDLSQVLPTLQEQHGLQSELTQLKQVRFKYLYNGFHCGEISDLAVCTQRPLFVTICGADGSVRVWNYVSMRCDLARKFEGRDGQNLGLQSVAFHPSGYYIALGFRDKLRVFHLLHRDLRLYKELALTNASKLKFSNGGHFLAAAFQPFGSNHNHIVIFNAYSFEVEHVLKAHHNKIVSLAWSHRDRFIYSCGEDGSTN